MTTTARQALNALIDDLVAGPTRTQPVPEPRLAYAAQAPVLDRPTPAAVLATPPPMPEQRTVPQAYTVLPTGARNAILWRSRTA